EFIVAEDAILTVILEIRDYLRGYPGVYSAQGVNANAESLLVIDVEIPDHSVSIRRGEPPAGQDAANGGITLENRPPADDLPVGIVCLSVYHMIRHPLFG
ncbi:MAG: hypothetical protein KBA49_08620, partial [Methanolinea sp.]|nr:hypothetical protein [Methanolinea sp.]